MSLLNQPAMIAGVYFQTCTDVETHSSRAGFGWVSEKLRNAFISEGDADSVRKADKLLLSRGLDKPTVSTIRRILNNHVMEYVHDLALKGTGLVIQTGDQYYLGIRINGEPLSINPDAIKEVKEKFARDHVLHALLQPQQSRRIRPAGGNSPAASRF